MPIIFKASNYLTRKDLNRAISAEIGNDIKINKEAGHSILGSKNELKKLQLDDNCSIYGCRVVSSDITTETELRAKLKEKGKKWQI